MAKRFTDTDIWDKEWFMALSCKHKCLIKFLYDKSDVAGIWSENWLLASSYIGEKVTELDLDFLPGRVIKLANKKYLLVDFIDFQYGTLSVKCKPHQKVLAIIEKHKSDLQKIIGYRYPIQRVLEEEEDKEEEKEKDKEENNENLKFWDSTKKQFLSGGDWQFKFCTDKKITIAFFDTEAEDFLKLIEEKQDYKNLKELRNHFVNFYNVREKINKNERRSSNIGKVLDFDAA